MVDKVLELGGYAAGYAGRLYAHAGADVVRVEYGVTPPAWASPVAMDSFLHAGKRRVATSDPTLIQQLAAAADVVICEASGADAVHALGFQEWSTPVKAALTPFGLTGPKRNWHATPNTLLAMGGYTVLMGDAEREPLSLPGHYLEFQTGALAYTACNAAQLAGQSTDIDIGMLETLMSLSQFTTVRWHCAGELRTRHGSDFWFVVPSELFRCTDGWAYINIVPQFWDAFTVFLDRPELLVDGRFTNNGLRMQHRTALHEIVAEVLATFSVAQVHERAASCRVPVGVVQSFADVLDDPHLAERDFWQAVEAAPGAPEMSGVKLPSLPFRLGDKKSTRLHLNGVKPLTEPTLWGRLWGR
ncbi:MAG: CoA transferase [Pseudomonadota bacterium]